MTTAMSDVVNPFGGSLPAAVPRLGIMGGAIQQREIAEVQASMIIARANPRDERQAADDILQACTRVSLAEAALYDYGRGGSEVSGPSIRLAEAIAQRWGNIDYGTRELEQRDGESTVEAYAWDMQTNVRERRTFQVRHERHTNKGKYSLTDPRDIYETVSNQASRRLRACILAVIPKDIVDMAVQQVEATLKQKTQVTAETLATMVASFAELGVTREQLEKRVQRRLDTISGAQSVNLRKIYNSIKDGMSGPADWFPPAGAPTPIAGAEVPPPMPPAAPPEPPSPAEPPAEPTRTAAVREALRGRPKRQEPPPQPEAPPPRPLATPEPGEILADLLDIARSARTSDELSLAYDLARNLSGQEAERARDELARASLRIEANG